MPSASWSACYAAWAAVSVGVLLRINRTVNEPYMDEIFHVPQAQAYCRGDWKYWDPALTTPPGLYLLPAALAHGKRHIESLVGFLPASLAKSDPCALSPLRASNLAIALLLPFIYSSLLHLLHMPSENGRLSRRRYDWEGLVVATFPLVQWWSWLFYTDMASVVCLLLCWRAALKKTHIKAALLGATSLLFRQTNIVWVAFVAAQAVIRELMLRKEAVDIVKTPLAVAYAAVTNLPSLAPVVSAYLPVCLAFLAFVKWNGGIVLGDKQNHVATVHVAQLFYLVAFAGVLFAPLLLTPVQTGYYQVRFAINKLAGSPRRAACSLLALVGMCLTIKHYTIAHPFLLADNRHFCFYLWRRVINLRWWTRYALSIGYLVAGRLIYDGLARARLMTLSTLLLFVGATLAVLIPSPLLEPRYFLLPLLLIRLYLSPSSSTSVASDHHRKLVLEAAFYLAIQAVCVWLFLEKPFLWDIEVGADGKGLGGRDAREVGRLQRFMW